MKWVSEMENVIFTTKKEEFKEFAALKMNVVNVLKFIEKIRGPYERQSGCKFLKKILKIVDICFNWLFKTVQS